MSDFSFESLDKARANAGALNLPVRISSFDLANGIAKGERLDPGFSGVEAEVEVYLNADPKAGQREFERPDMKRISRKVSAGGVVRFDRAAEASKGRFTADWPTILSTRPAPDQHVLVGNIRVRPYVPPRRDQDQHRLGLEYIMPGTAYELGREARDRHQQIAEALHNILVVPDSARPWGTPCAWFHIRAGNQARSTLSVSQFDKSGSIKPVEQHFEDYLARVEAQTISAALDAGVSVVLTTGRVFYWGRDLIMTAVKKNRGMPDRWYRVKDAQDTCFAASSLAIRQRESGSWFFTEVLPLKLQPEYRSTDAILGEIAAAEAPGPEVPA